MLDLTRVRGEERRLAEAKKDTVQLPQEALMTREREQPRDPERESPRDPAHETVVDPQAVPRRQSPELEPFPGPDTPQQPERPPTPI